MTGSMKWYKYLDDQDQEWGVFLDETTGVVGALGFVAVASTDQLDQLPRGHYMRYVNTTKMTGGGGAGFVQSRFPVGSLDATAWTEQNITLTVGGSTYVKTSSRGEARRLVIDKNTGLTGPTP